jgi:hypothetical protein
MALFDTPSLLDVIWRKETFPGDGGAIAGITEGLQDGLQAADDYKQEKAQYEQVNALNRAQPIVQHSAAPAPQRVAPVGMQQPSGFGVGRAGFPGLYNSINKMVNYGQGNI